MKDKRLGEAEIKELGEHHSLTYHNDSIMMLYYCMAKFKQQKRIS